MIEFDARKDRTNLQKHGVPLSLAGELFKSPTLEALDTRHEEERWIAIGLAQARVFVCIYTWRDEKRRIISLRKATRRETNAYFKSQS